MIEFIIRYSFKVGLAYLFLFVVCIPGSGQSTNWKFTAEEQAIYEEAFKLKTGPASRMLNQTRESPAKFYLTNLINVIELLGNERLTLYYRYKEVYNELYDQIKDVKSSSPYQQFYLAEMQLQWALVHLKFGEELSAVWELRQAYRKTRSNLDKNPEFYPSLKTMGLLQVMIGSVPAKYNWLLSILGLSGNVVSGLEQLEKVAANDPLFGYEARGILAVIDTYMLDQAALGNSLLEEAYTEQPDNLLVHYLLISNLIKMHRGKEALEKINTFTYSSGHMKLPIMSYLKAELYLQRGAYQNAINYYNDYIRIQRSGNYIRDSYYKISLAYLLSGDKEQARRYFSLARENGSERVEADKHALTQLKEETLPHASIMKARLFTDGGYYQKADSVLRIVDPANLNDHDRTELLYRKARIADLTGSEEEARQFYRSVIQRNQDRPWYFGPNSALMMGELFLKEQQPDSAAYYFRAAMEFPSHEYENSINAKAKSALRRLGQ